MTQSVTGRVDSVTYTEKDGKYGKYYIANVSLGGQTFNGLRKNKDVVEGSDVLILYETTQYGNNIVKDGIKPTSVNTSDTTKSTNTGTLSNAGPFKIASGSFNNTLGQIKGNSVTNAVNLAIRNKASGKVTLENLTEAFDLVLQLHKYAESVDIKEAISAGSTTKETS